MQECPWISHENLTLKWEEFATSLILLRVLAKLLNIYVRSNPGLTFSCLNSKISRTALRRCSLFQRCLSKIVCFTN